MSKMAAEHDAINLSQGFPNFPVDTVLDIVIRLAKIMFINTFHGGLSSFIVKQNWFKKPTEEFFCQK
jgi:hypothetical protein